MSAFLSIAGLVIVVVGAIATAVISSDRMGRNVCICIAIGLFVFLIGRTEAEDPVGFIVVVALMALVAAVGALYERRAKQREVSREHVSLVWQMPELYREPYADLEQRTAHYRHGEWSAQLSPADLLVLGACAQDLARVPTE